MPRFRKMLYLMAANFDVLRVRAVASADFDGDRLFAAAMCAETFQRRFARLLSVSNGFPSAIRQSDQYSPVTPVTRGLAASNVCVAAPWLGDFMNSCMGDSTTRKGSPMYFRRA